MIKVGNTLKEERKKRNLTIEQVAKATKIRSSFLQAIEEGNYEKLPGGSYAHGFVKNYLEFLGLSTREYMPLFRREYDEKEYRKLIPEGLVGKESIPLKKFSLPQTVLLAIIIISIVAGYILFQYRAAIWNPTLTIDNPKENTVTTSRVITIRGKTDQNTAVTVNDVPTYINANGTFTKTIPVFPGYVTFSIKAVNSFGKMSTVERHITVKVEQ